jgi:dihydroxyacetone kinase
MGLGVAEDADRSVRGTKKAGENAEKRGLARTVFAEKNVAAAGLERERDLAESGKAAKELGHLIESSVKGPRAEG